MTAPPGPSLPLPTLRRVLLGRMTVLLIALAVVVLLVFGLGVRTVSLLHARRQAVQLVERTGQRFSQKLDQVERLGSMLSRLWAGGQFDPAEGFLPDAILVQAGSLSSLSGLIVARADGRTSVLMRQENHWTLQRLTPLGDGRSRAEHDEWDPAQGQPPSQGDQRDCLGCPHPALVPPGSEPEGGLLDAPLCLPPTAARPASLSRCRCGTGRTGCWASWRWTMRSRPSGNCSGKRCPPRTARPCSWTQRAPFWPPRPWQELTSPFSE